MRKDPPSAKKSLGLLLRVAISFLAMAGLIYALRDKLGEALLIVRGGLRWEWFLLAVGINLAATGLISRRLQIVFLVQKVRIKFLQTFYLSFLGLFFTLFFPSALGGDVAKGYYAYQYSGKKLGSLTGVVLDRLIGLVALVTIALVAILGYSRRLANPLIEKSIYGAVALLVFGIFFFSSHRFAKSFGFLSFLVPSASWREKLSDLYHAIREYKNHKKLLVTCCIISLVAQLLYLSLSFFLARALGISISLWPCFVLMPLVAFVSMAPSLSGLGVREAGFVFFFKTLMPAEQAFALSLLYDLIFYGTALAGGLLFAFKGGLRREVIHDLEEIERLEEVKYDR